MAHTGRDRSRRGRHPDPGVYVAVGGANRTLGLLVAAVLVALGVALLVEGVHRRPLVVIEPTRVGFGRDGGRMWWTDRDRIGTVAIRRNIAVQVGCFSSNGALLASHVVSYVDVKDMRRAFDSAGFPLVGMGRQGRRGNTATAAASGRGDGQRPSDRPGRALRRPGARRRLAQQLIWGDNLHVLGSLADEPAGQVDLIYIDPPFDSRQDYKVRNAVGDGGDAAD